MKSRGIGYQSIGRTIKPTIGYGIYSSLVKVANTRTRKSSDDEMVGMIPLATTGKLLTEISRGIKP